jgi:2-polyprenyl-3-methyl-5-hydroxy-6-metoxy-1,4-benzoquinol methylase
MKKDESMYKIGNIRINLDYYSGEDYYSDGDIENEIAEIVKNNSDYTEILSKDDRWPILYHLSPLRRNLLEWYEFKEDANILEIGAGCGALTGLFCEKAKEVVAIELSKRRAEVIASRYKENTNLEIIAGNISNIKFTKRFDYITLIGVLEYAGKYYSSNSPYFDFLLSIKKLLKPDGVLIIAIENKFGIKYWAGAREDHNGSFFSGLENYVENKEIITFSKDELKELINCAGFNKINYYYPMPDYKLPIQLFSDARTPSTEEMVGYFPNYDNDRIKLFNEKLVYNNLIKNNKYDFFANSFLVFTSF